MSLYAFSYFFFFDENYSPYVGNAEIVLTACTSYNVPSTMSNTSLNSFDSSHNFFINNNYMGIFIQYISV